MKSLVDSIFLRSPEENTPEVSTSLCRSYFIPLIALCVAAAVTDLVFFVYVLINSAVYGSYLPAYCSMYILMAALAVTCFVLTLYVKRDVENRYRLFSPVCITMALLSAAWTLGLTALDINLFEKIDPTLFMTFMIAVPFCACLEPVTFLLISLSGCIGFFTMLWYFTGKTGFSGASLIYYIIFFIAQMLLGLVVITLKRGEVMGRLKLDANRKQTEKILESQSHFFSNMSHEIRTPVNTIIGLNEMILREDISEEVAEDALNVRSAGKILLHLVNDILDMSKFETGQMRLTPVVYNTADMLSEIAGMFYIRAGEKSLAFHVNVASDLPKELRADDVRIKQMLVDVLSNAVKYTKEGSVTLTVECGEKRGENINIIYTVRDTGIGIKKEDIPYLFTTFGRTYEQRNRQEKGIGMGLSIVKQFVDLMGGKITVNSIYTKGSTFVIEIPQRQIGAATVGDIDLEDRRSLVDSQIYKRRFEAPDAKVLIVDDNASNLMVASKLLRDTNIQITTVTSGAEALKAALDERYHVILMDDMMPEMSGVEVLHRLRNQVGGLCRESKVVALTAKAGNDSRVYYEKEGFDGYISKPVSGLELEKEMFRLLPEELIHMTGDDEGLVKNTISWMNTAVKRKHIAISTESVADLPKELIEKYDIDIIPHNIITSEGIFRDSMEIETRGLLSYMEDPGRKIDTKAPGVAEHEEYFAKELTRANNIIHITLSEKVKNSGYAAAREAAKTFDNVTVVDTGQISSGQGMLVLMACHLAIMGKSPEEITERIKESSKKIHTSFIVDSLDYLIMADQVSVRLEALLRSFNARPVLGLKNGRLGVKEMIFENRERAWKKYIANAFKSPGRIDRNILFITYAGMTSSELEFVKDEVERLISFRQIYMQKASSAVAANCGPKSFGLIFREH